MSIAETIVLGSIAFFASVISDTERVLQPDYILFVMNVLDSQWLSDSSNLIICISIVVVLLVASKNGFQALVNYWSNYWSIRWAYSMDGGSKNQESNLWSRSNVGSNLMFALEQKPVLDLWSRIYMNRSPSGIGSISVSVRGRT
jgi:hypothetical protein